MTTAVRQPAVAGRFYPGNAQHLRTEVETFTTPRATAGQKAVETETKIPAVGCVVPHAGYVYSGAVAGAVYRRLKLPRRCVILCPNHTGMGEPLAIMSRGRMAHSAGRRTGRCRSRRSTQSRRALAQRRSGGSSLSSMPWKCSFRSCRYCGPAFVSSPSPSAPATSKPSARSETQSGTSWQI